MTRPAVPHDDPPSDRVWPPTGNRALASSLRLSRHSSSQLLAATFERLLPHVIPPAPSTGPLRSQLIELLSRQASLFAAAPLHVTTLACLTLGSQVVTQGKRRRADPNRNAAHPGNRPVPPTVRRHSQSSHAREELDDFDIELAMCNSSDRWFSHEEPGYETSTGTTARTSLTTFSPPTNAHTPLHRNARSTRPQRKELVESRRHWQNKFGEWLAAKHGSVHFEAGRETGMAEWQTT